MNERKREKKKNEKKIKHILKMISKQDSEVENARHNRFIEEMMTLTQGIGDPGFRGRGKRFVDDILDRTGAGGTEGGIFDIDQFSDDSNVSDLDISSSEDDGANDN
jgi:hypothetical protein